MSADHCAAIRLTTMAAGYIRAQFLTHLHGTSNPIPPSEFAAHMIWNCNYIAEEIAKAFQNSSQLTVIQAAECQLIIIVMTSWSVKEYTKHLSPRQSGRNKSVEDTLQHKYPPIYLETRLIQKACIVTDNEGNILLWYLPQAFMLNIVVSKLIGADICTNDSDGATEGAVGQS